MGTLDAKRAEGKRTFLWGDAWWFFSGPRWKFHNGPYVCESEATKAMRKYDVKNTKRDRRRKHKEEAQGERGGIAADPRG